MTLFENTHKPINLPQIFKPFQCNQLIRLGKDNDGGYLVNKHDVENSKILISLGIGSDWTFEKDFSLINDCKVISFDKDAVISNDDNFYTNHRKIVHKHVNLFSSEDTVSFDDILQIESEKIFLKCDIEGKEYDFLKTIIEYDFKFSGIVIEFHQINDHKNFDKLTNFIAKIKQKLVHIHTNNYRFSFDAQIPEVMELTFTSSSNINYNPNITLPNPLDMSNCKGAYDYKLVFES